jgi:hypothetical protein
MKLSLSKSINRAVRLLKDDDLIPATTVKYIESDGEQYIDTGVTIKSTLCIRTKFLSNDGDSQFASIFGADLGSSQNYRGFAFDINNNSNISFNYFGSSTTSQTINKHGSNLLFENHYNIACLSVIDDSKTYSISRGFQTFDYNNANIYLFATNRVGTGAICLSKIKLYSFQIRDKEELLRDFVPVKDSNGTYCLYD